MLFISPYASPLVATSLWMLCGIRGKPLAIRFFGGDFDEFYAATFSLNRYIARKTYLSGPLILMQTKRLCMLFKTFSGVQWLPNTRDIRFSLEDNNKSVEKLVFISQLRKDKGCLEAMEAVEKLPPEFQLDIYGPAMPDTDMEIFQKYPRCKYRGVLRPEDIPPVLSRSGLLLLPTYYHGEGYPGIILESLQCGTPVITTSWKDIPEIIQDGNNGFLIHPRSVNEIVDTVLRIREDKDLYNKVSEGARKTGEFFRTARWHQLLERKLLKLIN